MLIARYPDDDGWYLLYFDKNGQEVTDTYHDSLTGAMQQAEYEFGVVGSDWEMMNGWEQ